MKKEHAPARIAPSLPTVRQAVTRQCRIMEMATTTESPASVILDRLLDPISGCLTPAVARRLVELRADPIAQARVEELARKSTAGTLSPRERAEYETYVSAGTFIAILQSKGRTLLAAERRR